MKKSLLIVALLTAVSCRSLSPKSASPTNVPETKRSNLTQTEAEERAAAVANVRYDLKLILDPGSDEFFGTLTIDFNLRKTVSSLFLDFRSDATVESLSQNGQAGVAAPVEGGRVNLSPKVLIPGKNRVQISFRQKYSNDGSGLYRFKDPEDGALYHYTQFEAFDANHMFPCFDQPDLKAPLKLSVIVPVDWRVISTTPNPVVKIEGGKRRWTFPATPPISPYLYSLIAGPYAEWTSAAGAIPLRLFARQSLKKYVNPEDWFGPTRKGLPFFGNYFGFPYPFKKYDQIIVPDFNAGAMENVAAVTFSERYVRRGPMSDEQRENLTNTILHEMAHMWFGDLVTMKWWDGLWLNESFATHMASFAAVEAAGLKDAWRTFSTRTKSWAMWEDQLVTTHPINGLVRDVRSAFTTFDGITYGKGASVLRQLKFYLGEPAFRDGLRLYFKKNAYANTKISDFIGALETSSRKDLGAWAKLWLERQGVDTVTADYACSRETITRFTLRLTPPAGETSLRPHRAIVALYGPNLKVQKQTDVTQTTPTTDIPAFVGEPCPSMVYPNVEDHDYVRVHLDERTLSQMRGHMMEIEDPALRTLLWRELSQMLEDASIASTDVLPVLENALAHEKDLKIFSALMHRAPDILQLLPQSTPAEKGAEAEALVAIEDIVWKRVLDAKPASEEQRLAFDGFLGLARSSAVADRLVSLLNAKTVLRGFPMDQDYRWAILIRLSALGNPQSAALLDAEKARDPSERGVQSALTAEAARPDPVVKRQWFERVIADQSLTHARMRSALAEFFPTWQSDLRASFGDRFYSELPRLAKTREPDFLHTFTNLMPTVCTADGLAKMDDFLKKNQAELPPEVLKSLKIGRQEDSRCLAARDLARTATKKR